MYAHMHLYKEVKVRRDSELRMVCSLWYYKIQFAYLHVVLAYLWSFIPHLLCFTFS